MNLKIGNRLLALLITAILVISTAALIQPINAQDQSHGYVNIGTPQQTFTGGPVPAGVTPSVNIETIAYMSFSPNPIGIGQQLLVNLWVQPATSVARAHTGYSVIITEPDGNIVTIGPMVSYGGDTTAWFTYIPTVAGNYTLQFFFAGDYYPKGAYVDGIVNGTKTAYSAAATFNATQDCFYKPSQSAKYPLTVQQDFVSSWQETPPPTDYWTRPISPMNRLWWVIGGSDPSYEVGGGTGTTGWPDNTNVYTNNYNFVSYATGPKSAHIAWRRQGALDGIFGGLIDGAYTQYQAPNLMYNNAVSTFQQVGPGLSGNPNIVFEGRCYQAITKPFNGITQTVWECYDLRTGEIYWDLTNVTRIPTLISFAENTPPVPGALGRTDRTVASLVYIGASAVSGTGLVVKYDPMTGAVTLNQTIPLTSGTLYADPNVLSVQTLGSGSNTQYRLINWTLQGLGSNFTANIISNITYPFASIGTADYESMIACTTYSSADPATGVASNVNVAAANLLTGQLLWNKSADIGYPVFTGSANVADHGKLALRFDDGYYYAWDLRTGARLWKSALSSYPWGTFGAYAEQSAYGLLFYEQYDGIVAYNWTNGQIAWWFQAPATPFETPYTNGTGELNSQVYSFFSGARIADGILYAQSAEHSPTAPHIRGWRLFAVNATSGQEIWSTPGALAGGVISDGYLTASNYYDGFLYVFGKGPSTITVSVPQTQITIGQNTIISGTVLDQSPAQPGTPCISEASIGDWMAYLHQQQPFPASVTGVPISIDAIDPNSNPVHIATVTSDASGTFSYTWAPQISGDYKITATFAGDGSYGSSWAQTAANVVSEAAPTSTQTSAPAQSAPDYNMTIIGMGIAVILAVAIVGALILKKRP
jgi:hypothetical protein